MRRFQRAAAPIPSTPPGRAPSGSALTEFQAGIGNAALTRLVQGEASSRGHGPALARYKVPFGPKEDCAKVVNWINKSGPYASTGGAARTRTPLKANWGTPKVEGTAPTFTVTVPQLTVTLEKHKPDMPEWTPSDPDVASAWAAAMADLSAHEAEHVAKGELYERIVGEQLRMMKVEVSAANQNEAMSKASTEFQDAFKLWVESLQASHKAIDPYQVKMTCPKKSQP